MIVCKMVWLPVLGLFGSWLTANVLAGWRLPSDPMTCAVAVQPETTGTARTATPIDASLALRADTPVSSFRVIVTEPSGLLATAKAGGALVATLIASTAVVAVGRSGRPAPPPPSATTDDTNEPPHESEMAGRVTHQGRGTPPTRQGTADGAVTANATRARQNGASRTDRHYVIGLIVGAILGALSVPGWVIGLLVATVTVILSAVLHRFSRVR